MLHRHVAPSDIRLVVAVVFCTALLVLIPACSSSRDARTATTADILFRGKEIEEANREKRSGLERLQVRSEELDSENAQLERELDQKLLELVRAEEQMDVLDQEIRAMETEIKQLEKELSDNQGVNNELEDRLNRLKTKQKARAAISHNIIELKQAIQGLEASIDQRINLEQEKH